jgi:hypothetical protein
MHQSQVLTAQPQKLSLSTRDKSHISRGLKAQTKMANT